MNAKDIRVGQLVKLEGDEAVPCDLLLIACESTSGQSQSFCQIRSDNLDGESNLKVYNSLSRLILYDYYIMSLVLNRCDSVHLD